MFCATLPCLLTMSLWISAKLYMPKVNKSSGAAIDMWIKVLPLFLSLCVSVSVCVGARACWLFFKHFYKNFFNQAKELDANTDYYIELLAKGTGKTKEEINKDICRPKYFNAQEAIDYGLADKIVDSSDDAFEKRVWFSLYLCFLLHCAHQPALR